MKLCPICDKKLTGNFCPSCKKLVRNPLVIPDGIRLNETHYGNDDMCEFHAGDRSFTFLNRRHPENEENCSYHEKAPAPKKQEQTFASGSAKNSSAIKLFPLIFFLMLILMTSVFFVIVTTVINMMSGIHI